MQDTIEIALPVSKFKVVIRNYTTRADDEAAETVLTEGVFTSELAGTQYPAANVLKYQTFYIERLVQSVNGQADKIHDLLGELRSADYEAVREAVDKIVAENSPKATAAATASSSDTNAK